MKVLELLDEIEEIIDTASGFPLTGKIMVDASELLELTKEIRTELPDEIHQAQWIKNERERILGDAKVEYETVMNDAKKQADYLVENHEITMRAKKRAEDLLSVTESNVKKLKMSTYDYIDNILFNFQEKMDEMNVIFILLKCLTTWKEPSQESTKLWQITEMKSKILLIAPKWKARVLSPKR